MPRTWTTRQAASVLAVPYGRLWGALRSGKVEPLPVKDHYGFFTWTAEDIERARQALATDLRRKREPAAAGGGAV